MSMSLSKVAGRVIACEPSPRIRYILERHVIMNELQEKISIVHAALSDVAESAKFYEGADSKGTGTLRDDYNGSDESFTLVPVRVGDEVVKDLNVDRVDLIKLDAQGLEHKALDGLSVTIRKDMPVIVYTFGRMIYRSIDGIQKIRRSIGDGYSHFMILNQFNPSTSVTSFNFEVDKEEDGVYVVVAVPDRLLKSFGASISIV
jgi:FkbM family methyltransferase